MSIEQDARAEAEKRWPTVGNFSAVAALRIAFINGYIARAHRPVTDAEVEAACDGFYTHGIATWSGLVNGDPELADRYRVWMREALEAARNVNRETGGSES